MNKICQALEVIILAQISQLHFVCLYLDKFTVCARRVCNTSKLIDFSRFCVYPSLAYSRLRIVFQNLRLILCKYNPSPFLLVYLDFIQEYCKIIIANKAK